MLQRLAKSLQLDEWFDQERGHYPGVSEKCRVPGPSPGPDYDLYYEEISG